MRENRSKKNDEFVGVLLLLFSPYLLVCVFTGRVHPFALVVYVGASLVAFVTYWVDKKAAANGTWRTRESTLHMLALLGGWPGAFLAQRAIRHKTSKASFQAAFVITSLLNIAAFVIYSSPPATAALLSGAQWLINNKELQSILNG